MFCRSLFVLLYFFFWPLYCLFFFDIRILIIPLVSSNSSVYIDMPNWCVYYFINVLAIWVLQLLIYIYKDISHLFLGFISSLYVLIFISLTSFCLLMIKFTMFLFMPVMLMIIFTMFLFMPVMLMIKFTMFLFMPVIYVWISRFSAF